MDVIAVIVILLALLVIAVYTAVIVALLLLGLVVCCLSVADDLKYVTSLLIEAAYVTYRAVKKVWMRCQ